jgi:hypothetical protein
MDEPFVSGVCVECLRAAMPVQQPTPLPPKTTSKPIRWPAALIAVLAILIVFAIFETLAGERGVTGGLLILAATVGIPIAIAFVSLAAIVALFVWLVKFFLRGGS